MFGRAKKKKRLEGQLPASSATKPEIKLIEPKDRRKIGGPRTVCYCEFSSPNPDPFKAHSLPIQGLMKLNARGCSVYPKSNITLEHMTAETFEEWFIGNRLTIKAMKLTRKDGTHYTIADLGIKGTRFVNDKNGRGIVFKFVNLSERQLDQLLEFMAINE